MASTMAPVLFMACIVANLQLLAICLCCLCCPVVEGRVLDVRVAVPHDLHIADITRNLSTACSHHHLQIYSATCPAARRSAGLRC